MFATSFALSIREASKPREPDVKYARCVTASTAFESIGGAVVVCSGAVLAAVLAQAARGSSTRRHAHACLRLLLWLLGIHDALLDVAGKTVKGLFHVDVALGRNLHEGDSKLVCQRLSLLGRHGSLLFPIALVANQDLVDALGRVLLDVGEPCSDVCFNHMLVVSAHTAYPSLSCCLVGGIKHTVEAALVGNVIYQ